MDKSFSSIIRNSDTSERSFEHVPYITETTGRRNQQIQNYSRIKENTSIFTHYR